LSRIVWRIATDTKDCEADDLSGAGAKRTGGRWNETGVPVLYTSETQALACLETVVHLNAGGLPLNRYLVAVTIPDSVWATARTETPSSLPVGWDAAPAGRVSIRRGTTWIKSGASLLLTAAKSPPGSAENISTIHVQPNSKSFLFLFFKKEILPSALK
jgi:RES domain-containing protein